MAARRQRNRPRRRRGRFGLLYKLLSFLAILAALVAGCAAFFRVNHIDVSGNSRYTAEEVVQASELEMGSNLMTLNRLQCAVVITRKLPYIENVSVLKHYPDGVELRVTECTAAAALEAQGSWWLLNEDCKFLEQTQDPGDLPRILGLTPLAPSVAGHMAVDQEGGSEQVKLDGLKSLLAALRERGMSEGLSRFVDLSSGSTIYFGYGENLTVMVPVSGDFDRRILSLARVLETFEQRGETVSGTLDLTYGDNTARLLTSQWLPEQTTAPAVSAAPETSAVPASPTASADGGA